MISLINLQLWILTQMLMLAFCWRYMGVSRLVSGLLGTTVYLESFK
jgi:hypothetical protein